MGSILAQTDLGEILLARKHKGEENKDIRSMEGMKGKKGFVRPEDREGGNIKWDKVEDRIESLCNVWGCKGVKRN